MEGGGVGQDAREGGRGGGAGTGTTTGEEKAVAARSSSSPKDAAAARPSRQQAALGESAAFTNVALDADGDSNDSGTDVEPEDDEDQRNISMESDRLDPEEKAAHEADTLPMDGPGAAEVRGAGKAKGKKGSAGDRSRKMARTLYEKAHSSAGPFLRSQQPLPENPTRRQRVLDAVRCPPHGRVGRYCSLSLLTVVLWVSCLSAFGAVASPPHGTIFLLIVLVVCAMLLGQVFTLMRLPALLGMLITGIVLKNIPGIQFQEDWKAWSSTLRSLALVIILTRAGLGLDPKALRRLSGMVFRLAFSPCLVETLVVAVSSHFLLDFPILWGFMLGFVLAAVSPAVVVPCLLQLQEKGYGVDKGIPTLVIAAASVDDVLAISGFTILLGITMKPDLNLAAAIVQGPAEALAGLVAGVLWGLLLYFLPGKDDPNCTSLRFCFLLGGGVIALFGSAAIHLPGAGALGVLVLAFVAGVGWRKRDKQEEPAVASYFANLWIVFQPVLFGLIGTEIQIDKLDGATVGLGILVLVIGLSFRVVTSFFAVMGGDLTLKERLFVALAWLPKATVQAAIGPLAYDQARNLAEPRPQFEELGLQILTIAVLVILITAPIGSVAIMLSAPHLLQKGQAARREGDPEAAGSASNGDRASQKSQ